jgi:hypothetical protein
MDGTYNKASNLAANCAPLAFSRSIVRLAVTASQMDGVFGSDTPKHLFAVDFP